MPLSIHRCWPVQWRRLKRVTSVERQLVRKSFLYQVSLNQKESMRDNDTSRCVNDNFESYQQDQCRNASVDHYPDIHLMKTRLRTLTIQRQQAILRKYASTTVCGAKHIQAQSSHLRGKKAFVSCEVEGWVSETLIQSGSDLDLWCWCPTYVTTESLLRVAPTKIVSGNAGMRDSW